MKCTSSRSPTSGRRARLLSAFGLATALAVLLASAPVLRAQQPIQIFLSAVDSAGKPVTDLKAEDVSVLTNGSPCTVTRFEPIDWPTKLQLLVDNGPVHTDALRQLREALRLFINELPPDMEVSLVSFVPAPRFIYKAGTDRVKLLKAVDLLIPDSGAPKFIDALSEAADRIAKDRSKNKEKANYFSTIMIVGSSGVEGSSALDSQVNKMFRQIVENAVTVHIAMETNANGSVDVGTGTNQIEIGLQITKATGGRYESFNSETRLSTLLPEYGKQIARSVERQSHQYRVTCTPTGGGAPKQVAASINRANVSAALSIDGRVP